MRFRQLLELTQPYVEKKIDPGLMTFEEYYRLLNPQNKNHPSNAYDMNLAKINEIYKKAEFTIPVRTIRVNNIPLEIRLRKTDRFQEYQFVKHDAEDNILRDEKGNALYFTPEEMMRSGKRRWEYSLGVFYKDTCVAFTADEWGCVLVVVAEEYRGWGIGPIIQKMARELEPGKTSGGFTPQGANSLRKIHGEFVREYLANGMYSYLVKSRQLTAERAKQIIQSVGARPQPKQQFNLDSNKPDDWLLYAGEAGDFVMYDRKLKELVDAGVVDSDQYAHWVHEMLIGAVYASGSNGYAHVHQFGGKTEQVKAFMMRLALTEVSRHGEVLVFTPDLQKYVTQAGVEVNQNEARLISNPVNYAAMTTAEARWRKSFDRYDEFRMRLLELAYGKYQITR